MRKNVAKSIAVNMQRKAHAEERKQLARHQRWEITKFIADQMRERKAKRAHQKLERAEQRKAQRKEREDLRNSFKRARRPKSYARMAADEDFEV